MSPSGMKLPTRNGKFLKSVSTCDAVDFNGESHAKTVDNMGTGLSLSEYRKLKLSKFVVIK